MEIACPFGKRAVALDIPDENIVTVVEGTEKTAGDERALMERALEHPINGPRLEDLSGRAVVVVDDKTRPLPAQKMLPPVLERLGDDVTVLFATGTHVPMTQRDVDAVLGRDIARAQG